MRPIIAAIITAVLLAGCADSEPASATPTKSAVEIDGGSRLTVVTIDVGWRNINCVVLIDGDRKSGVSCDFTRSAN